MHLLWYFPDGEGGRKTQWSLDWLTPKNRDRPWPWDGEEEEDNYQWLEVYGPYGPDF